MGGSVDGAGNRTAGAEANIHNDPDAAKLVFDTFSDITMAGLNLSRQLPLTEGFRTKVTRLTFVLPINH
jgi:purine nucleosidase